MLSSTRALLDQCWQRDCLLTSQVLDNQTTKHAGLVDNDRSIDTRTTTHKPPPPPLIRPFSHPLALLHYVLIGMLDDGVPVPRVFAPSPGSAAVRSVAQHERDLPGD